MRQGKKSKVDLATGGGVVGPERTITVRQLGMHVSQNPAGMRVSTEIHQVKAGVAVDELDQLATGIAGSAEDRRADIHEVAKYTHMRIARGAWYVEERFTFYVLRQALVGPVARSFAAF
jgi:hypothetical protein